MYLYLFLKTLKKLPKIQFNQKLYKFIQNEIKTEEDNSNKKLIPYKNEITKTFWGFTSVNLSKKMEYVNIKNENSSGKNTLFMIDGDTYGYGITLFNNSGKEKYLLEPEKEYIIKNILPPINDIIIISCKIVKSQTFFENNKIEEQNQNEDNLLEKNEICSDEKLIYDTYFPKINKYNIIIIRAKSLNFII